MRRERIHQNMRSQPALASRAGISPRKVSDVERGEFAGAKTYDAIENALGWPANSIREYLDGGAEPQVPPRSADTPHEWSAAERDRMRDMPWTEVRETYEVFRRRSEYVSDVWMREVLRVKAASEQAKIATDS